MAQKKLSELGPGKFGVVELAKQRQIPHQLAVHGRGATDARVIHVAHGGISTIVLGVPVRYAHSVNGMIHLEDFKAMVELTAAIVVELDEGRGRALIT